MPTKRTLGIPYLGLDSHKDTEAKTWKSAPRNTDTLQRTHARQVHPISLGSRSYRRGDSHHSLMPFLRLSHYLAWRSIHHWLHLGLQLLLLPSDLLLCLLVELSHFVEMVRVSPTGTGGWAPESCWGPLELDACSPPASLALSHLRPLSCHLGSMISPPPPLALTIYGPHCPKPRSPS